MIPMVLCYVFGTALLVLEIFLPGFGVAGIAGILLELACIVLTWFSYSGIMALIVTAICVATVAVSVFLGVRSLQRGRLDKSGLVLENAEDPQRQELSFGIGTAGQAVTALRPAGTGLLKGKRVEVVSAVGFIPAGTEIRVTGTEGSKILVEKA